MFTNLLAANAPLTQFLNKTSSRVLLATIMSTSAHANIQSCYQLLTHPSGVSNLLTNDQTKKTPELKSNSNFWTLKIKDTPEESSEKSLTVSAFKIQKYHALSVLNAIGAVRTEFYSSYLQNPHKIQNELELGNQIVSLKQNGKDHLLLVPNHLVIDVSSSGRSAHKVKRLAQKLINNLNSHLESSIAKNQVPTETLLDLKILTILAKTPEGLQEINSSLNKQLLSSATQPYFQKLLPQVTNTNVLPPYLHLIALSEMVLLPENIEKAKLPSQLQFLENMEPLGAPSKNYYSLATHNLNNFYFSNQSVGSTASARRGVSYERAFEIFENLKLSNFDFVVFTEVQKEAIEQFAKQFATNEYTIVAPESNGKVAYHNIAFGYRSNIPIQVTVEPLFQKGHKSFTHGAYAFNIFDKSSPIPTSAQTPLAVIVGGHVKAHARRANYKTEAQKLEEIDRLIEDLSDGNHSQYSMAQLKNKRRKLVRRIKGIIDTQEQVHEREHLEFAAIIKSLETRSEGKVPLLFAGDLNLTSDNSLESLPSLLKEFQSMRTSAHSPANSATQFGHLNGTFASLELDAILGNPEAQKYIVQEPQAPNTETMLYNLKYGNHNGEITTNSLAKLPSDHIPVISILKPQFLQSK